MVGGQQNISLGCSVSYRRWIRHGRGMPGINNPTIPAVIYIICFVCRDYSVLFNELSNIKCLRCIAINVPNRLSVSSPQLT